MLSSDSIEKVILGGTNLGLTIDQVWTHDKYVCLLLDLDHDENHDTGSVELGGECYERTRHIKTDSSPTMIPPTKPARHLMAGISVKAWYTTEGCSKPITRFWCYGIF